MNGEYYFYLNPYGGYGYSCSKCPKCEGKTKLKKIPLAISLEKIKAILILNKTCKYCPYCKLLTANKISFTKLPPESNAHKYAYLMRKDNKNKMGIYVKISLEEIEKWLKK